MSHRKEENLDFDYLNSGVPDQSNGYVYYSSEPTYHSYSAEPVAPNSYQQHYSNYPNPFQNAKQDYQYSPVQRNMFSSESYESGAKGYSRTYSGNDLLAENASSSASSASGRCLKRYNSDIPSYCEFGTYNPFQGSPLEIANLSLLESRTVEEQVTNVSEPVYETEIVPEEAVVPPEAVQNKRSYKDVLTFPQRSESPSSAEQLSKGKNDGEVRKDTPKDGISFPLRSDSPSSTEAMSKPKVENEIRKETYKDKLLSPKLETSTPTSKAPPVKSNLNNSRSQINTNPKRPLKINNNLAAGNNISANKTNGKSPNEKNYSLNDSVRSVRSQTDLGGIRKKGGPSLMDNASFELPPSDDDYVPSPVEIRANRSDLKRAEKGKSKIREKEINERSTKTRHQKKNPPARKSVLWIRAYFSKIVNLCGWFCIWLYNLCADVIRMSCDLSWVGLQHCRTTLWEKGFLVTDWLKIQTRKGRHYFTTQWLPSIREFSRYFRRGSASENSTNASGGLNANIPLPSTGEEAMHRLLACKGRDPYSILGVRRDCSDEEIRRYYKRQAVLVHPDKNRQRGAEEAFKILAHAFELIGQPERRSHYDQLVQEADEMESAWAELNELLSRLHAKMDEEANTIRCTNCAKRHRRVKTDRPCYAARYCQDCKIHHSAREGDLWAESRLMGFRSNYYACMEGAVYDITEWANCQAGHLRHLQSNSHRVQYRIVPGQGQGQQNHGNGRKLS